MSANGRLTGKRAIVAGGGIATGGMADLYGGGWLRAEREWGAPMHARSCNGRVEEIAAAPCSWRAMGLRS